MSARLSILVTSCVLFASAAGAEEPQEAVAVVALEERAQQEALIVDRIARRWVDRSPLVDLLDLGDLAMGSRFDEMQEHLEQARSVKAAGMEAYDMMSYEQALMRLERAIEAFQGSDLTEHLDELLETYFMRALAFYYEGQVSRARNQLRDLFSLKRDFRPDRGRVTPEIESLMDEARESVEESPRTSLEIQTEPTSALVYVDGIYQGVSPVEVRDLIPGQHFVTARALGYLLAQERQLAAPGEIARIRLDSSSHGRELRARLETLRMGLKGREPSEHAVSIAEWADADQVLAIGVGLSGEEVTLVGFRFAADGHLQAYDRVRVPIDALDEDGRAISNFLDELHFSSLPRGEGGEPVPTLSSPFSFDLDFGNREWAFVAGGAGVATAVGGLFVGLSARSRAVEARSIPQLDVEQYDDAMKGAKRRALLADGLYLTAAAGVALGVFLFLQDDTPSSGGGGGLKGERSFGAGVGPFSDGAVLSVEGRF